MDKQQLVNNFKTKLGEAHNLWLGNVVYNFAKAYDDAYGRYQATLKKQDETDAQNRALLFLALSLVGGTAFTAAIGKIGAKALLKDVAINVMVDRSVQRVFGERLFNLAARLEASPAASFAIGAVVDEVLNRAKASASDALKTAVSTPEYPQASGTPFATKVHLEDKLMDARNLAIMAVNELILENPRVSAQQAQAVLRTFEQAPMIANAPKLGHYIPENIASEGMELIMYLNLIMTRDHIHARDVTGTKSAFTIESRTPINKSPFDPTYPKDVGNRYDFKRVEYQDIGGVLVDRINELHRKFRKRDLIKKGTPIIGHNLDRNEFEEAYRALEFMNQRYGRPDLTTWSV